jgi:RNA polymerase sigma-70 factor, ECF subfamily
MPEPTDAELVAAYLAGDENSFAELTRRHLSAVFGYVARLIGRTRDAEDATQEVFVKIWRNLKKYDQSKNFRTWAFTIAKNTVLDSLKKKKDVAFSDFDNDDSDADGEGNVLTDTLVDPAPLPPEIFDRADLADRVVAVVDSLPAKQRLVLHLHYREQLTFAEIGEVLGEPLHTVKSRHHRGLQSLRANLTNAPKDDFTS